MSRLLRKMQELATELEERAELAGRESSTAGWGGDFDGGKEIAYEASAELLRELLLPFEAEQAERENESRLQAEQAEQDAAKERDWYFHSEGESDE